MADNVTVDTGTGITVATDDVGSAHYQRVKVVWGVDGAAADASATNPLPVVAETLALEEGGVLDDISTKLTTLDTTVSGGVVPLGQTDGANSLPFIEATDSVIPDIFGNLDDATGVGAAATARRVTLAAEEIRWVDVTMTTDTNAYAAGDVIADSQIVASCMKGNDVPGMLQSITVIDRSDQKLPFIIYFLSANVSLGTENGAPNISDDDAGNILGFLEIFSTDYKDLGGVSVAYKSGLGMVMKPVTGSDDIYVGIINGPQAPTYAADAIRLRLGFTG